MIRCIRFPRSPKIFGYLVAQIYNCSVDTELICRNHCAEKQLDVFMTTIECVLTSCSLLCFVILLSQRHWKHEILDDRILGNLPSCSLQIDSMNRRVCLCRFRTISLLIQAPRKTNDREGICEHNSQLSLNCIHTLSVFPSSLHAMSLYIDMKMILSLKCSGSHCRFFIRS